MNESIQALGLSLLVGLLLMVALIDIWGDQPEPKEPLFPEWYNVQLEADLIVDACWEVR